jgi:signal transduction histidine kinase
MSKPIRVLVVEDSDDDVVLLLHELARGGYQPLHCKVETRAQMEQALTQSEWDLVVSDYSMPTFSGLEALAVLRQLARDIPFIIVSGNIGEDVAVAAMKAGAHDYVMKRNLSRLVPAVERELRDAEVRHARWQAERVLRENEARFRALASNIPGMVYQFLRRPDGSESFQYVSEGCPKLLAVSAQALLSNAQLFLDLILPEDRASYDRAMARSAAELTDINWEGRIRINTANEIKWVNLRSSPRLLDDRATQWEGIMSNITHSKLAELEIKRSREQLSELSSHIQTVKENERTHIAREIHDDIGGNLTAIKIDLLWLTNRLPKDSKLLLDKARAMERLVDRTMETTSRISRDLRPGILDLGLVAAIEWQSEEFEARMSIPCEVSVPDEDIMLDQDLSAALFRIFQETLTNVSKHARATRVRVNLKVTADEVVLEVVDNGCGISKDNMAKTGSFGIRGMIERARSLGGEFTVQGHPGRGTRSLVRMPYGAPGESQHLEQRALF